MNAVVCYDGNARGGEEGKGRGGNTVVDREEVSGGVVYGGAAAVFIGHDVLVIG